MKRLFYILASILLLSACSDEEDLQKQIAVKEGDPVTLTVSIQTPEETALQTRALGEMTDNIQKNLNLWLLVFDENSIFVQAAQAEVGDNVEHNGHTDTQFNVELNATSAKRIIHFIAYDGEANEGVGAIIQSLQNQFGTESSMLQQLYTENNHAAYWQRWEVNGIYADDPLTPEDEGTKFVCVPLVRNFSKITITSAATGFTIQGYTIVKTPSRGAVAPYANGSFVEYVNDRTNKTFDELKSYPGTTPSGTTYSTSNTLQTTGPLYLYETPNADGDDKGRTSIVMQGSWNNNTYYYKVDLVYYDTENEAAGHLFYNILRNFNYEVKINEVNGAGYGTLAAAIAGAASNNLSASTATSSLSIISDGTQKLEVSKTYFCFTESGVQQVLKYRFSYKNGNDWVVNNDLVDVTSSNDALFNGGSSGWSVATTNDAEGWRTITMNLNSPTAQTQTSIFHIYASIYKINASTSLSAPLKQTLTSGEMLYRDVHIDLRNHYTMLVDCPSYVPAVVNQEFQANLLIPQNINEALFPMDILIEAGDKYIYPNASSSVRLPVHVGQSIVEGSTKNSFQYARTITKEEYRALLESTNPNDKKTVEGVNYIVVPCYFKTNIAASATTVFAYNEYFNLASDSYLNVPVAFQDDTELTVTSDYTEYFGKNYPVKIKFNVAYSTPFTITVTEGGDSHQYTVTPAVGEYEYTYYTQTINGNDQNISVSVTAQVTGRAAETKEATLAMNRRYFVIKANSFTTNIASFLDEGQTENGAYIYVDGESAGWFGNNIEPHSDGFLTNQGPKADYIIDRSLQGYATLTESTTVMIEVYDPNKVVRAHTTIGQLDNARNGTTTLYLEFAQE